VSARSPDRRGGQPKHRPARQRRSA
jgi:hypothetical protein